MNFNKILTGIIVIVIIVAGIVYFRSRKATAPRPSSMGEARPDDGAAATIETSMGSFEITLNAQAAPKTVANFIKLSNSGFYNGLIFHRIVKSEGFHLIQGGDPEGTGMGGPGYTIPAEIGLKHTKGAIATARTGDQVNPTRESSGSQFYIVEEDIPQLDGQYTVFGYVTSGMEVVEKIGAVETGANDLPVNKVIINKITIK